MKEYLNLIDSFIEGKINYGTFFDELSNSYAALEDADRKLKPDEISFMEDVYERSTFSNTVVDDQEKKEGLMNEDEYRDWLKKMKDKNIKFWENKSK